MKICSCCREELDLKCFGKHKSNPDYLQYQCKLCRKDNYTKDRERVLENVRLYQLTRKPEKSAYDMKRRELRGDQIREYDRIRASQPARRSLNARLTAKRRAVLKSAVTNWDHEFDDLVFKEAFDLAKKREHVTGFKWHVDHIIPLVNIQVCGLHCGYNIAVIPAISNILKSNKFEPHFERRV